ncbi:MULTISPECIES: hypothetical protein [unclassified Bradyrhizobium]|uniref:hypothetical protein n=1 Tax=unclassified Bradyrhizobium TaxID=2631580 RepID=UPI0028E55C70|nr:MULTISPECIES: hypothetical protein [unclassified Bradyrhizobium]
MTSEVALLNKSAIALAADSATTVTYYEKNEHKTRYFKGANKVFNLSRAHPVGVMTFASASLSGVPWEIIIKSYRAHLGKNSHDRLSEYAADFFNFIESNSLLFPLDVQEKQFIALADRAAAQLLLPVTSADHYVAADAATKSQIVLDALKTRENALPNVGFIPAADQHDIDDAITKHLGLVTAHFRADPYYVAFVPDSEMERAAKIGIAGVFKLDLEGQGTTGLAFAGFGESEYFPKLEQYRCYGLILGKSYVYKEQEVTIDHSQSAEVVPLAQSNMIDTFVHGASFPTMNIVHSIFVKRFDELESGLKAGGLVPASADLGALRQGAEDEFRREVAAYYFNEHRRPLARVIASLPINELAELAETLVYIESLKERVTTPEETVSGPIDVAVISKHDGFIWIKRKHYFKPELNHRFFFNQQREE